MMDGISVRQFAKLLRVSDTAVNKAISKGYIVEGHNPSGGRQSINYEVALKEWNSRPGAKEVVSMVDIKTAKEKTEKAQVKKDFIVSDSEDEEESTLVDDVAPVLKKGAKITDVALVEAYWKAKKSELLVAELNGTLVKKDTVFKELFQLGSEMRAKMQSIPDKVIDNIMAAKTRGEAHKILYDEITKSLEALSAKNIKI